ncbi:MAG: electron transfer flavoprotein subunit beta/FixA family protein [Acidimicrobiia bacterium]|nr:electron transfer flavoprotein subunit beta/FixA family protein [Acidimicrobiia bacterium]NNC41978.1 electron transfer flavoprotein subunit beta/FixA family protein [Acidimicrobiia bacterium]NND13053.1 electron transfer flavoprotein subunit beta/FixA family protein [Acidimicrobiia bacterium]NNL26876.1 electron transfer flavoprotein subunit beta/FixA family protein [Acidimicrobiia bacterium]
MNIVVCVKQIPDPANPYSLDPETHLLIRPDEQVLDDTDRYGVEVGLQLAAQTEGTVTLVSMGPAGNMQGIRQALAMGADKAIMIDDADLKGSGALTTAKILAAAIQRSGFDLVLAGTESTDGYTGVVPQQIAELLDVPALTFAKQVSVDASTVTINQQTANGYNVVTSELPAVISVTAGVVEPRYPTFKGIMAAKSKPVENYTASDLGVSDTDPGQAIISVDEATERKAGTKIEDEGEAHLRIIEKLQELKVI